MQTGRIIIATLIAAALAPLASAEDAVGKWTGGVKTPNGDLPVVVTISKADDGSLKGFLESPSQTTMQIPSEGFTSDGKSLSFTSEVVMGSYAATWDDAKKIWAGIWKQGGQEMSLDLKRAP